MNLKLSSLASKKRLKWILLFLIILVFLSLLILVILYIIACNVGHVYTLLIDAGSTSSKLTVFKWKDWPFQKNGYVEEVMMARVKPGISAYKGNPENASKTLQPHIQRLLEQGIPSQSQSSSRMFLAATAGMRLLTLENALKSEAIIEDLQLQLPRTGLVVNNPYSDVRIMSGRDEGIYAWITVNYLAKKLGAPKVSPVEEKATLGALDLGGASTQIAFVPQDSSPAPHTSTRSLFGKKYTLYSYSYLCYGKSAMEKRTWAEIIGNQSSATIDNPCLLTGHSLNVTTTDLFGEQCVSSKYAEDLIGNKLLPNQTLPSVITFNGTGNWNKCREVVMKVFYKKPCNQEPCMFNAVYRPNLRGKFYAFSGFTYVTAYLDFPPKGQEPTKEEFSRRVEAFCSKNWKDIETSPNSAVEALYCFDGVYVEALLSGYGFDTSESWKNIIFALKIDGVTVSWAPGYVIDASGMIESTSPKIDLGLEAFAALVSFLSVVFVLLLTLILLIFWRS